MNVKIRGYIFTILLATAVVFIFFGKIIPDPNNYYFSPDGDGFKAYYGAVYHLEYDTSAMRMNGMNYPYGEMVFFTGSQPLVVNTVKFISNHFFDISGNIVGIINLLMIFSIVLAAGFIYLLFYELDVNWIYASLVSVGICMLSPQIGRFGGHFSLSWLFWIPLMLYLVFRFHKKATFFNAGLIALVTFLSGAMHMYFYGFNGFIIGFYLFAQTVNKKRRFGWLKVILFFFIQFVLPLLIFQLLMSSYDSVTDRTAFPYGFFSYRAHPVGVLLPSGKPYSFVPEVFTVFKHIQWESLSFVGVTAFVGFLYGVVTFIKKVFAPRNALEVTDRFILNVFFWTSFLALLFSFGIPFILGLEWLLDYLGPFRQLRALARFAWLFYYILNIVVFYSLYKKVTENKGVILWKTITVFAVGFLLFDGYWNIYINSRYVQNRKPEMEDIINSMPQNEWVNHINSNDYQAILPLPYFHVGSENIWIGSQFGTQEMTMIASLKTGLPTTAVQLSRTSISQTYKNYALVNEPFEPFALLSDLPDSKPFLLLINRKHNPNIDEQRLIQFSDSVFKNDVVEIRKLPISELKSIREKYISEIERDFRNAKLFDRDSVEITDSTSFFILKTFDDRKSATTYGGKGALQYPDHQWEAIFDDTLNVDPGKKYKVSFWMYGYKKDGYLRAAVEMIQKNAKTQELTNYFYSDVHRHIKGFDGEWAMIEFAYEPKSKNEALKISLRNDVLKDVTFVLDELLVREAGADIYYPTNSIRYRNTRKLPNDLF